MAKNVWMFVGSLSNLLACFPEALRWLDSECSSAGKPNVLSAFGTFAETRWLLMESGA